MAALQGRAGIFETLIPGCLARPAGSRGTRDVPIVLLLGPRGSGKTVLLDAVGRRFKDVPQAALDFDATGPMRPRTAVISLAFQLARKCGKYGRLPFPRLLLGLLVVDSDIPL